jgi:hypothetical protein
MANPLAQESICNNKCSVIFDGINFVNWNLSFWFPIQRNELKEIVLRTDRIPDEMNFIIRFIILRQSLTKKYGFPPKF